MNIIEEGIDPGAGRDSEVVRDEAVVATTEAALNAASLFYRERAVAEPV